MVEYLPQACNQFEVAHICRIEWHQTEDPEVKMNHSPANQSKPVSECQNHKLYIFLNMK